MDGWLSIVVSVGESVLDVVWEDDVEVELTFDVASWRLLQLSQYLAQWWILLLRLGADRRTVELTQLWWCSVTETIRTHAATVHHHIVSLKVSSHVPKTPTRLSRLSCRQQSDTVKWRRRRRCEHTSHDSWSESSINTSSHLWRWRDSTVELTWVASTS